MNLGAVNKAVLYIGMIFIMQLMVLGFECICADVFYQQVRQLSNGKRTIHINPTVIHIISELYDKASHNLQKNLILNRKGKPAGYHDLQRTFATIWRNCGIEPFGIHSLRHYFASKCIAEGVEILALSKHLGHSSPTITLSIYAHLTNQQSESFNKILNMLN